MADTMPQKLSTDPDETDGVAERSPFEPARITEGYPFDEVDQRVLRRLLDDVGRRRYGTEKSPDGPHLPR